MFILSCICSLALCICTSQSSLLKTSVSIPMELLREWKHWSTRLALHQACGYQDKTWDLMCYKRILLGFFCTIKILGRYRIFQNLA